MGRAYLVNTVGSEIDDFERQVRSEAVVVEFDRARDAVRFELSVIRAE